jgi:hypothetical protein
MPAFTGGWWLPLYDIQKELVLAVLVCLLDVVESTSIARALAQKNKYKLNFTQELRGLGLANLGGALFNSYTTTGSFSRSAVNNSVGAKTPLAGFITGVTVGLVLLVLTPGEAPSCSRLGCVWRGGAAGRPRCRLPCWPGKSRATHWQHALWSLVKRHPADFLPPPPSSAAQCSPT